MTAIFGLAMTVAADSRDFIRESDHAWIAELLSADLGRGSLIAGTVALSIYAVWFAVTLGSGQSPGKQIAGIRIIRVSGEPSGWSYTFVREVILKGLVAHFLAIITAGLFILVDYLWPLWDRNRQTLHDKMAETLVVQVSPVPRLNSDESKPQARPTK